MTITKADLIEALKSLIFPDTKMREALREELPPKARLIRFSGSFVNIWGYGDNIYLGLDLREAGVPAAPAQIGYLGSTPILYRMNPNGKLETLLTSDQANAVAGYTVGEIVAVLEAPDGAVFCTAHPEPASILKYAGGVWSRVYQNASFRTMYGLAVGYFGYLYATGRGPATLPGGPIRAVVRSIDRGASWSIVHSEAADLLFTVKTREATVLAGGSNVIFRSANNGATWTDIVVVGRIREIVNVDRYVWLAFIGDSNRFLVSLDDGVTWFEPANKLPIVTCGAMNCAVISPNGQIVINSFDAARFAVSKNMGSTWHVGGQVYAGSLSRGIYAIGSHVYIGGFVHTSSSYYGVADNGMVFISTLEGLELAENYPPVSLWSSQSITDLVNGSTTSPILTQGVNKKTFYIYSTQAGTLYIQAYDEVGVTYRNIDSMVMAATTLTPYQTTYGARLMRLRFVPSVAATVDAWAVLE